MLDNAALEALLRAADVPGIATAIVVDGRPMRTRCAGRRDVRVPAPVDHGTVFDAASLSKPVFAHVVLQLADQGVLGLDTPLAAYLPSYMPHDGPEAAITARHVLCHSAGLPNWRSLDMPLKSYFAPGTRFSYSGEGYLFLQSVAEFLTGETLDVLARRLVFRPFAMRRSGFVWQPRFGGNRAAAHNDFGKPAVTWKPGEGNAAATLQTTAADYGRFLLHVLRGARLSPEMALLWMRPQITVNHAKPQALGADFEVADPGIAWGPGWGFEPAAGTFFQWGNNGNFMAFAIGVQRLGLAFCAFMNGASGLALMPAVLASVIPGERASLAWLGTGRHDDPVRRLLHEARAQGAPAIWGEMERAGLRRDEIQWIARGLRAEGRDDEAGWLGEKVSKATTG